MHNKSENIQDNNEQTNTGTKKIILLQHHHKKILGINLANQAQTYPLKNIKHNWKTVPNKWKKIPVNVTEDLQLLIYHYSLNWSTDSMYFPYESQLASL